MGGCLGLLSLKLLMDASLIFVLYPAALPAQTSETARPGSLAVCQLDKSQRLQNRLGEALVQEFDLSLELE